MPLYSEYREGTSPMRDLWPFSEKKGEEGNRSK